MPYLNFNSASPTLKLAITVMSIITIGIVVWFTGFLLSRLFFNINVPEVNELLHGETGSMSLAQMKYYQIIQTIGFFVIPGFFLQWLFSTPEESYFNINKRPAIQSSLLVAITLIIAIPLINYVIKYNQSIQFPDILKDLEVKLQNLEKSAESLTMQLLAVNGFASYLMNILMIAIIPAIGEEFIFRGVFQKIFHNISKNKHMAVILAAILFSAVHGQFYGFIPRFILGVFFGYLLIWSKTIWLPVFAHFINNAIAVTLYYLYELGIINLSPDNFGLKFMGGTIVIISAVLCILGVLVVKYFESKRVLED